MAAKCAYLYAGRITEVVGDSSPNDTSHAIGPVGTDANPDVYINTNMDLREPAAVFTVRTAKRGKKPRLVALPLNYEPWARELGKYFDARGEKLVFPFTRQHVGDVIRESGVFEGLEYPIEKYTIWQEKVAGPPVERHLRPFNLHALRHLRASELVEHYGFDGIDLAIYGGWTFRASVGVGSLDRYLSLGWQRYFPKLLRK